MYASRFLLYKYKEPTFRVTLLYDMQIMFVENTGVEFALTSTR